MWSYLKAHYVQESGALQHTLMQQLHVMKRETCPLMSTNLLLIG